MSHTTLPVGEGNTVLLQGIVGSTAYGLATEHSDVDRLGMYVMPTEELFGLHADPVNKRSKTSGEGAELDYAAHEVAKYVSLALSCNPTASELLWLPEDCYEVRSPEADDLVALRDCLWNAKGVADAFGGYAYSQFKRLTDRGKYPDVSPQRIAKHSRHLLRLLHQGTQLYVTGKLEVRLDEPDRFHRFGAQVQELSEAGRADEVREVVKRELDHAKNVFDGPSVLPDRPDTEPVEEWLRKVRYSRLTATEVRSYGEAVRVSGFAR